MPEAGLKRMARVAAAVAVVAAGFVAQAASPAAATTCMPIDLSTGGSFLGIDPDWQVLPPGGTVAASAANVPTHAGWVTPPVGTSWISESSATASGASPGTWRYRFTIVAPPGAPATPLTLRSAADNGVTFVLDGVPLGGYMATGPTDHTPFNQLHTLTTPPLTWLPGPHTLDAFVHNLGGPTALLVSGTLDLCTPECEAAPILVRESNTDVLAISPVHVQGTGSDSAALAYGTNTIGPVTVTYQDLSASCQVSATSAWATAEVGRARVAIGSNVVDIVAGRAYVSTTSTSYANDCTTAEVVVNGTPLVGTCPGTSLLSPFVVLDEEVDIGTYHQVAIAHIEVGTVDVYIGYAAAVV
jgi:hypothetical protein